MVTFLVAAALLVAALAAAPLAAHLLRRGRAEEREFPPASLVPPHPPIAHQRSRLQDRVLLALRIALVVALALLGATPLVQCSRLTLTREAGASIALALVVDDSLSMRALTKSGESRWQLAMSGARELLRSAREGDAVAIVLGGQPARLALAATTDLDAARRTLDELSPSDRSTDLGDAVQIARSALQQLPHVDRRVVLLSDLADDPIPAGNPEVWAPLADIRRPMNNCGLASAERRGRRVTVELACASSSAARGRRLQVIATPNRKPTPSPPSGDDGEVLAEAQLAARAGTQELAVELSRGEGTLTAQLVQGDALARDDTAPVGSESGSLAVAVVADPALSSVVTGGPTLAEQALDALARGPAVSPLTLVPDDGRQLAQFAALILDDPSGLPAEARMELTRWIDRGGVALALLGPRAESAQLGSSLEPFAGGVVGWEQAPATPGLDPTSLGFMGGEALGLASLAPRGRAELEGTVLPGGRVVGRWQDGRAFVVERALGQGLTLTAGLPTSVAASDFALRPGFLALLDYLLDKAIERTGPKRSVAGTTWRFPGTVPVEVQGPTGPLSVRDAPRLASDSEPGPPERFVTVTEVGRYLVTAGGDTHERIVTSEAREMSRQPDEAKLPGDRLTASGNAPRADASAALALAVLALLLLELVLRLIGHLSARRHRLAQR